MADSKMTQEEMERKVRETCDEAAAVLKALQPTCKTLQEAVEVLELASVNDCQLKMLIAEITRKR